MANSRNYSNTAVSTTLNGAITNVGTSVILSSQTGMPSTPFLLSIEPDTSNEEIVLATSGAGTGGSPYIVTRGQDGTANIAHSNLVTVQHRVAALDFTDSRTHEASSANIHGLNGASISVNGGTQSLTSLISLNTSTTETLISKSFTIAAGSLVTGSAYRICVYGTIGCTSTPTCTIRMKLGSTVIASAVITCSATLSGGLVIAGTVGCLATGVSGTMAGSVEASTSLHTTNPTAASPVGGGTQTINTTASQALTVTAQWSASSASNAIVAYASTIEQLF